MEERYLLSGERIREIIEEQILPPSVGEVFHTLAEFLLLLRETLEEVSSGKLREKSLTELRTLNHTLYAYYDREPGVSSGIPEGYVLRFLRVFYGEILSAIPFAFEQDREQLLIREELFLLVYGMFASAEEGTYPKEEALRESLYYYVSDYTRAWTDKKTGYMLDDERDFATRLITEEDLSDVRTLYFYGEYVTETEEETLRFLNTLPEEDIKKMADTFTEGYRLGFLATNKDISKKSIVNIRYNLGFEPVIRTAIDNFRAMGFTPCIYRAYQNLLSGRGMNRVGYYGAVYSRQYDFEHKDDQALFLDNKLLTVRLEALEQAYGKRKERAALFGGPAVMETFGEKPPELITKEDAPRLSGEQQKSLVSYASKAMEIQNRYIIEEERSFTIIAFPTPAIGKDFPEIFREVIRLNTLDYRTYQRIQQHLIDALDRGACVKVKGKGANETDLRIALRTPEDPEKETAFENCVADVNIPVGEVFTSPLLTGTCGLLHVSRVFLNGLEYRDLRIRIRDGMVEDYSCTNFDTPEENRAYFRDNVLCHHETLPMGEFAVGTNTTAYRMARRFHIEALLPILIAEKTGPHFAFGDTCYSHEEDALTYNPDGKKIIAKENECSSRRREDPESAYFNCHTDVTIPYEELGSITAVTKEGEEIPIISDGLFVLPGTEELNGPLIKS